MVRNGMILIAFLTEGTHFQLFSILLCLLFTRTPPPQDALSEPLVNFLVTQALGVDPSIFTDQLSALSSIDPAQLDAMADVADLLIEASHCVLRSRLEPMQSEDRLEDQSKDLAVLNELLAGKALADPIQGNSLIK